MITTDDMICENETFRYKPLVNELPDDVYPLAHGTTVSRYELIANESGVWLGLGCDGHMRMGRVLELNGEPAKHSAFDELVEFASDMAHNYGTIVRAGQPDPTWCWPSEK